MAVYLLTLLFLLSRSVKVWYVAQLRKLHFPTAYVYELCIYKLIYVNKWEHHSPYYYIIGRRLLGELAGDQN